MNDAYNSLETALGKLGKSLYETNNVAAEAAPAADAAEAVSATDGVHAEVEADFDVDA